MDSVFSRSSTGSWRWTRCILLDDGTNHTPHRYRMTESKRSEYKLVVRYSKPNLFFLSTNSPTRAQAASLLRFLDHTQLDTYVPGWSLLDEWSARRRDLYLHNTQQTHQTKIHARDGIRTRNPSNEAALDRMTTRIGIEMHLNIECLLDRASL